MPFSKHSKKILDYALQFLASILGVILTFYIWNFSDMNNILVCEALILIFSLLFPGKHDDTFFSAALAGLTAKRYLPNPGFVFLLAIFVFLIFNSVKKILIGFGGKLGTIAFFSNLLACFFAYLGESDEYPFYDHNYYEVLDVYIYVFGPLVCGVSCLLAYIYHNYFHLTKNVALNVNGLLDCLVLLLIDTIPNYADGKRFSLSYGEIYCYFAQIGLLVALMKEENFSKVRFRGCIFHHYFLVALLAGWIYIGVYGFFSVGGKNGFMAFISSNIYIRTIRIFTPNDKKTNLNNKIFDIEIKNLSNHDQVFTNNQNNNKVFTTEEDPKEEKDSENRLTKKDNDGVDKDVAEGNKIFFEKKVSSSVLKSPSQIYDIQKINHIIEEAGKENELKIKVEESNKII